MPRSTFCKEAGGHGKKREALRSYQSPVLSRCDVYLPVPKS